MKRSTLWVAGLLLALGTASQAKLGVDTTVSTGLFGRYVFRGARLSSTSIQTDLTLTKQFSSQISGTAYLWTTHAMAPANGNPRWQEADYDVSLNWKPSKVWGVTGGWVFYHAIHPGFDYRHEAELYGKLDMYAWNGSPGIGLYYAHMTTPGLYGDLHASRSFNWGKGVTLNTYGELGFNFHADKMTHGLVRTAVNFDLGQGWSAGPRVDWWFPTAYADAAANGFRPELAATIAYNTSF